VIDLMENGASAIAAACRPGRCGCRSGQGLDDGLRRRTVAFRLAVQNYVPTEDEELTSHAKAGPVIFGTRRRRSRCHQRHRPELFGPTRNPRTPSARRAARAAGRRPQWPPVSSRRQYNDGGSIRTPASNCGLALTEAAWPHPTGPRPTCEGRRTRRPRTVRTARHCSTRRPAISAQLMKLPTAERPFLGRPAVRPAGADCSSHSMLLA
jgi:hypothetical protein